MLACNAFNSFNLLGVVGHLDGFRLSLKLDQRQQRAEGLLRERQHVSGHVGDHRGLEEGAALCVQLGVWLAAYQQCGAFLHAIFYMRQNLNAGKKHMKKVSERINELISSKRT